MRSNRVLRVFLAVMVVILVLALVLAGVGVSTVRRSFPQTAGEIALDGLDGPVDVLRDSFGVVHIYAESEHDLFFAQGYVHAQDRFWQMDFWRHISAGRLSEMFGESQLDTDRFLRTLGWNRIAQQELETLDPESTATLDAYAAGVNAYLSARTGAELSLEYAVLGLLNAAYKPEPWSPVHTLSWAKVMAWDLGGNMNDEIWRTVLLNTLTPEQLAEIDPAYPADHPLIVPNFNLQTKQPINAGEITVDAEHHPSESIQSALMEVARQAGKLEALTGPRHSGIGSNSWVISAKRSGTGAPLLANDPHLGIQMPSIWYEVGLHCRAQSASCRLNVTGFSFAGAPGVVIGHNNRIAWGFTNVEPDVQDLFIEKINPQNPNQYEYKGEWVEMTLTPETILVAGGEPVELTVRSTRHGPLITDEYGPLEDLAGAKALELPDPYTVALRWTGLEPGTIFSAIWKINYAQNWEEFRQAATLFNVPPQNLIFADVDGNIGYQMPGNIPRRAAGDGRLPVPGWTGEYEWLDYIPFEELPYSYNPEEGYIATANNDIAGADYPYLISTGFDFGFRARRVVDMIEGASVPLDIADIQRMQGDNLDLSAEFTLPILADLSIEDSNLQSHRDWLTQWDMQAHMDSPQAGLYAAFWRHLLQHAFADQLPEEYPPTGSSHWFEVVRGLVGQPDNDWWDDIGTLEREGRDQIFTLALQDAVAELEDSLGRNAQNWRWGRLHGSTFINETLGQSGIAPIEALFNRGPFPTSGGSSIVNATGWDASESYAVITVPSMRMIVDLGRLENSLTIHTTGQSGHAYHPNYIDMAELWRNIQYNPMLWSSEQVQAMTAGRLLLTPR